MAVAYTVTQKHSAGDLFEVHGTFTSAAGDGNAETLTATTHGLNYLTAYAISLDPGAIMPPSPRIVRAAGTLTWTVDDTHGYSGRWWVRGR